MNSASFRSTGPADNARFSLKRLAFKLFTHILSLPTHLHCSYDFNTFLFLSITAYRISKLAPRSTYGIHVILRIYSKLCELILAVVYTLCLPPRSFKLCRQCILSYALLTSVFHIRGHQDGYFRKARDRQISNAWEHFTRELQKNNCRGTIN